MDFAERLDRELLRGVLPLCTLAVVAAEGPTYGYAITQSLASGGLGGVKGGTLYPLLQRLEDDGLVTTSWREGDRGPSRKYYAVTDGGRAALRAAAYRWAALTASATTLLAAGGEGSADVAARAPAPGTGHDDPAPPPTAPADETAAERAAQTPPAERTSR
jgi:DNA-binding PadR family transcriptional regulator